MAAPVQDWNERMVTQSGTSLPVVAGETRGAASASRLRAEIAQRIAVRVYRFAVVVMGIWLLGLAAMSAGRDSELGPIVSLVEAQRVFEEAERLGLLDEKRNGHTVFAADGVAIGFVMRTAPGMDHLVGYSGPSDLLIGLGPGGEIHRVVLATSRDTPAHVDDVRKNERFWHSFRGWNPAIDATSTVDGVSGSTLTSYAMVESVQQRLTGSSLSLRFPEELSSQNAVGFFPDAASVVQRDSRTGWNAVVDAGEQTLGYLMRTSPAADNVKGYRGPTEAIVAIEPDQKTIRGVSLRSSYDTPEFVERVSSSQDFMNRLKQVSVGEWPDIDFRAAGIEGVSGATQTSFGLAEGIRRRFLMDSELQIRTREDVSTRLRPRDWGLLAIVIGGLVMCFSRLRGVRAIRRCWQLVLVVGLGWFLGDLLSLSLLTGWARNGASFFAAPVLVGLAAIAVVIPWGTRRQIYCHQICPHGAVQEWTGRWRRLHVRLPRGLNRILHLVPAALLVCAFLLAIAFVKLDLSGWEPFDAWTLRGAAFVSMIVSVTGLVASFFVPQSYCRFGCPTGSLLKFVRSHGANDRFGIKEAVAGIAVAIAATIIVWQYGPGSLIPEYWKGTGSANSVLRMSGEALGTAWSVEFREPVRDAARIRDLLTAELEGIESLLSGNRPTSSVSAFNSSRTVLEMEYDAGFVALVARLKEFHEHDGETFVPTILPNHKLWENGSPDGKKVAALIRQMDLDRVKVSIEFNSLRKQDAELTVDLDPVLPGYAVDQLAEILKSQIDEEFTLRVGDYLWTIGD